MAIVTAGSRRSLLGKGIALVTARRAARPGRRGQLAAAAAKARQHVVTAAALAAFDLGAFQIHIPHCGSAPGWAGLCVSLLALDFAISGE